MEDLIKHFENLSALQLPTDYPRPLTRKYVEAEVSASPSNDFNKQVLRTSLDADCTPFTVLLALFSVLLHKMSTETDIVVGSSSQGSFEPCALRLAITGDMSFRRVIQVVQEEEQFADDHPCRFADLMEALRPKKAGEEAGPLCQVRFFNLVDVSKDTLDAVGACDWTVFIQQRATVKSVLPLHIRVSYNATLFKPARMTELMEQMQFVGKQVLGNLDVLLDDVSLVTPFAKSVIPDPCEVLSDKWEGSIQSYLSRNAAAFPNRDLIVDYDGKRYTYGQVNEMANKVANFLITQGKIQKEDVVAIFAHRSSPLVIAIMGILKSGATVCIIDPAYPPARQVIYLQVARPKALIVLEAAGVLLPEVKDYLLENPSIATILRGLQMDVSKIPQLQGVSGDEPNVEVGPESIGTLSFTSGSTGIPKGCRGRHISLTHFYPWMGTEFHLSEKDRFSMLSGIAHDPIQRDIFTPIFFGAQIWIPSHSDIVEPGRLARWMRDCEITIAVLTPAMGQLLTADATDSMPALRHAFFVGDVLTKRDCSRLQHLAPNIIIINMYGTTETQRSVSYLPIKNDASMAERKEIMPAGRGMKDVQLLILNKRMQMAGLGEAGEIFVRSHHLAAGYLGLDDASKEKFLLNPFIPGSTTDRFYRTGDVGRYLPDGVCECLGRSDDQVKLRGFRIELREIDTFLVQHPLVRESVTLLRRDVNEEHCLVTYFVTTNREVIDNFDVLRQHLREKLPSYAIPAIFVQLSQFPLTPNGKIDKQRLPFPTVTNNAAAPSHAAAGPQSSLEKILHDAFAENVVNKNFSDTDSFFDIGGHSISSTRVIFKVRQVLQIPDLPLNILYAHPTVKALAAAIEAQTDLTKLGQPEVTMKQKVVDLVREVEDIQLPTVSPDAKVVFPHKVSNIFLTGATGFLGGFLVRALLQKYPEATVHCLVRSSDEEAAKKRVIENMVNQQIFEPSFESRIKAVVGDLSQPRFGLSESSFAQLASLSDFIVHNGAIVHWVQPYEALKSSNVLSTAECIALATHGGHHLRPLYFISSTAVFETAYYQEVESVAEDDDLHAGTTLSIGYGQTKWVSERLLAKARRQLRLPCTVIRPGYIAGDSRTGVSNSDDFLWRLLSGCVQLQRHPAMKNRLNVVPVDFVAHLVAEITASQGSLNKSFHTINPHAFRFDDLFASLRHYGWPVESCEYMHWRTQLEQHTLSSNNNNALYPLLHFVLDDLPTKSRAPKLDDTNMKALCLSVNLSCPPMKDVLGLYLSYLVAVGFMPQPTETNATPLPPTSVANAILLSRTKK